MYTKSLTEKQGSSYIRGTGRVFWERSKKRTPPLLTEILSEVQGKVTDTKNKIAFRERKHKLVCICMLACSGRVRWVEMPGLVDTILKKPSLWRQSDIFSLDKNLDQ